MKWIEKESRQLFYLSSSLILVFLLCHSFLSYNHQLDPKLGILGYTVMDNERERRRRDSSQVNTDLIYSSLLASFSYQESFSFL